MTGLPESTVFICGGPRSRRLNKADLTRDVGIAPSPANHWLSTWRLHTDLLCALLNIRSEEALRQAPGVGAVWETFVFAQLREREPRAGRMGSLFFWCDRTREMDFVVDIGGRLELFEAKWTEVPSGSDAVNLDFVGPPAFRDLPTSFPIAAGLLAARDGTGVVAAQRTSFCAGSPRQ